MKVTISEDGCLRVSVETSVEAYALRKWWEGFDPSGTPCESSICVETAVLENSEGRTKVKDEKTERGFDISTFKDCYGVEASLQKSSIATVDCIWLGVNDPDPQIMASQAHLHGVETEETTGWVPFPVPKEVSIKTRMHLTQEQVAQLLPYLQRFVDTGEIYE